MSVERSELPVSIRQNQYKSKQIDVSVERSELPVSTCQNQYNSKQSDVSVGRSELPVSTRQSQYKSKQSDMSEKRSEKPVLRQNQSRGRGRPVVSADNPKITQNLRRTVNVEPPKQEKARLKKRVSWGSENDLIESHRISLDDRLKNIKVKVNTVDSNARNRSIEVTEERGLLIEGKSAFKFDEKTSFNIKDCVAKASLDKRRTNLLDIKDAASLPTSKESSSAKVEPKPIIVKCNFPTEREPSLVSHVSAAEQPSKEPADIGDEEEWEDLSGEDWESASDEE